MDKWDTLENKVTEKKGSPKWVVIVCVVIGVVLACGGFYVIIDPIVDEYLGDTKEIVGLYDFYDLKVGEEQIAVYFIGASHVAESVYPPEINRILAERGYEKISVYSAYVSSESPLDRAIHIQKLIDSKPSLIIYGVAASHLHKNMKVNEDNVIIVQNRLDVREDSLYLYTDSEKELLTGFKDPFPDKRFLESSLKYKFGQITPRYIVDYSVDPLGGEESRKKYFSARNEDAWKLLHDENYKIEYPLTEDSRTVEALHYILNTLEEENIPVVLMNSPINPLASDKLTLESREAYFKILNGTGYDWYDMEYSVSEDYFFDTTHTTFEGAMKLAPIYAEMIIQEVKSGAVHYA